MTRTSLRTISVVAALSVVIFLGADWTRFRGHDASGVSTDTGLPVTWSETANIVWKTPLPGYGASSPITLGDQIFLTCYGGYGFDKDAPGQQKDLKQAVFCLNRADGKVLWTQAVDARPPMAEYDGGRVDLHGYASSTLATDGTAVYGFFGRTGAVAFSMSGEPLWRTYVGDGIHGWGSATSPVLFDNLVIINASVESESVVALDKKTGKEVWRVGDIPKSWSTPLIVKAPGGSSELVISMKDKILAVDPATGKEFWHCAGVADYTCPAVIANDGIVYVTAGRKPQFFAVRAGGRGDVTGTHTLWETRATPKVSTPVYHDGYLYWIDQQGVAACADAKTGKVLYEERLELEGSSDKVYGSTVLADGKLYCLSREDGAVVWATGPKFKLLARNYLGDSSIFNSTPTVSNSQLLIRSDKCLYCIGN